MPKRLIRRSARLLTASLALAVPELALAQDFLCQKDEAVRWIQIDTEDPASELPCSVVYWLTPDVSRQLWFARYDRAFCEQKAAELRDKLNDEGWSCLAADNLLDDVPTQEAELPAEGAPPSTGGPLDPDIGPLGADEVPEPVEAVPARPAPAPTPAVPSVESQPAAPSGAAPSPVM
jgi:hypothetical protein